MRLSVALESLQAHAFERAAACLAFGAIMLLGAVLMLHRLGAAEVCSSNEAVEGLVVQQMVEHGNILFPLLNASEPMYKPPLFHWTATVLAHLLGVRDVSELTLRLPSVFYGLAGILLTMVLVRGWLGLPSAVLAGLVLLGSYQYIDEARFGRVDMALTFCEALALFAFCWWISARSDARARAGDSTRLGGRVTATHYLFAGALGLGVLAKGPVGMMLPLLAAVVFLLTQKRWDDLRALCSPGPALVLLAVSASWYAACLWSQHLDILHRQIISENFGRFFGDLYTMHPWYYLQPLLLNSLPFSLLVPVAVVHALRARGKNGSQRGLDTARAMILAIFWLTTIVFFSIAAYKRRAYLLPLWPPAAALLVWWLGTHPIERCRKVRTGAFALSCGALITFNFIYIPLAERAACHARYRDTVAAINQIVARGEPLYSWGLTEDPASLLFYLDRTVPPLPGSLADAPRGYIVVPEDAWTGDRANDALSPVLRFTAERRRLILLESRPHVPPS